MTPRSECPYSFQNFESSLRTQGVYKNQTMDAFLAFLGDTCEARRVTKLKSEMLWRSQLGIVGEEPEVTSFGPDGEPEDVDYMPQPYPAERMKPLPDRALEGRLNRQGTPVLYLSTDVETCIAESRPWKHAMVSVAEFLLTRDVSLIDCTSDPSSAKRVILPAEMLKSEAAVWESVNRALTKPAGRYADKAEYFAAQAIADVFRHHGFDGILYGSGYEDGKNIALYDLDLAECGPRYVHFVRDLQLGSSEASGPY